MRMTATVWQGESSATPDRISYRLKRIENVVNFYPFMRGHRLQNDGYQSLFYRIMQRDRDPLKPGT
jgi:hypothetical protein